jgi:branched-chain amino acid transport system substrate-binding protein
MFNSRKTAARQHVTSRETQNPSQNHKTGHNKLTIQEGTMKRQQGNTLSKLALAITTLSLVTGYAQAQAASERFRIGFITDMSGAYADTDGPGGVEAIKMAVEDAGGTVLGRKIEVLSADQQNKADKDAARAREWIDQQQIKM